MSDSEEYETLPPIWQMSQELADSLPGEDEINEHIERLIAEQADNMIKFDMAWKPPVYKWLLTTLLPNDCRVYAIFDTREQAVGYADEVMDIEPHLWYEDASEELRCHNSEGYHYYITQEIYNALTPGAVKDTIKESEQE